MGIGLNIAKGKWVAADMVDGSDINKVPTSKQGTAIDVAVHSKGIWVRSKEVHKGVANHLRELV